MQTIKNIASVVDRLCTLIELHHAVETSKITDPQKLRTLRQTESNMGFDALERSRYNGHPSTTDEFLSHEMQKRARERARLVKHRKRMVQEQRELEEMTA